MPYELKPSDEVSNGILFETGRTVPLIGYEARAKISSGFKPALEAGVPRSGLRPTTPEKPSGAWTKQPNRGSHDLTGSKSSKITISAVEPTGNASPRYEATI